MSKIRVLLLTNRDSDNVGDQIIEATVISLLRATFANLDVPVEDFEINSRAAGIISRAYMATRNPTLLEGARKAISEADVIVFGGAPLFNYTYQSFYLRTILTLELAQEYGVPVLFSSIGVEPFNADNPKSRALKDALALPCVRQITTRDDFESLAKYVEGTNTPIAHVSDPAVFSDIVFRKPKPKPAPAARPSLLRRIKRRVLRVLKGSPRKPPTPAPAQATPTAGPKRIGLVLTRAGIFRDNGIDFNEDAQRKFWLDVIALLTERGHDYRLFTTGHFSDEVFVDALARSSDIPLSKIALTVNSPEELIDELSASDGVIAYRLHASITSFAFNVPSIGLSWNFKVPYFYESVGYGERALSHEHWNALEVVDALEKAMAEGVTKDEAFLMSVYDTLFAGIRAIFAPTSERLSYTYAELHEQLPRYGGTSPAQYREKVRRKMRRTYEAYQKYSMYFLRAEAEKAKISS